jgi:hypothetical protein
MKRKIVFIIGVGHCGSTLLNLILSNADQAFGLGEIEQLRPKSRFFTGDQPFSNISEGKDTFWTEERTEKIRSFFANPGKIKRKLYQWGILAQPNPYVEVFKYMFGETSARVLIDSSKKPAWLNTVIPEIKHHTNFEPYLIYLVRDARAIINSFHQKYREQGLEQTIEDFKSSVSQMEDYYTNYDGKKIKLQYEDICTDPVNEIRKIMDWLDEEFELKMLRFWEGDHHQISGNTGTKSMILRFRERDYSHLLVYTATCEIEEHRIS